MRPRCAVDEINHNSSSGCAQITTAVLRRNCGYEDTGLTADVKVKLQIGTMDGLH